MLSHISALFYFYLANFYFGVVEKSPFAHMKRWAASHTNGYRLDARIPRNQAELANLPYFKRVIMIIMVVWSLTQYTLLSTSQNQTMKEVFE